MVAWRERLDVACRRPPRADSRAVALETVGRLRVHKPVEGTAARLGEAARPVAGFPTPGRGENPVRASDEDDDTDEDDSEGAGRISFDPPLQIKVFNFDAIIAEPVSETGLGDAIMDYLRRAAS